MAYVKFYTTVKSKATNTTTVPVVDGQFLIVTDTKQLMYDFGSTRIVLGDIVELDTETDRTSILAPLDKFYFVKSTHVLWRYTSGAWYSWADAATVSSHVAETLLSTNGAHGLKFDTTTNKLKYKNSNDQWVDVPMGGSSTATATLSSSGWSNGAQTVTVSGMTSSKNCVVGLAQSATKAQYDACCNARLVASAQGTNSLTITAHGDVPSVDIPISVIMLS